MSEVHTQRSRQVARTPSLAVVVSFLNEERYLPVLLESIAKQTEAPAQLLLVDDGSTDASAQIASDFAAAHPYARALRREKRLAETDRLVNAPELSSFTWGITQLEPGWDVVAKLDGDLELSKSLFADVRAAFASDPRLGITGSYLSTRSSSGELRRERNPSYHVRGPNKFYRRECYDQIVPLPGFLGWDTIDDLSARRLDWSTRSFTPLAGDAVHLRPTGAYDGGLKAYRRWGRCAWGYGAHPLWVLLGGLRRGAQRPFVLCGINYIWGWLSAGLHRYPRAAPELRQFCRAEEMARLRAGISAFLRTRLPREGMRERSE